MADTFPEALPVAPPLADEFTEAVESRNGEGLAERLPPIIDSEGASEAEGWGEEEKVGAFDDDPLPVPPKEGEEKTEGLGLLLPPPPLLLLTALGVAPRVAFEDPLLANDSLARGVCEEDPLEKEEGVARAVRAGVLDVHPV